MKLPVISWNRDDLAVPVQGITWKPVAEHWMTAPHGPEYRRLERNRITGSIREIVWKPEISASRANSEGGDGD